MKLPAARLKLPAARQRPRVASYAMVGVALLVVAFYAVWLTFRLRRDQQEEATQRAREELSTLAQVWEDSILERSAGWLTGLGQSAEPARHERAARGSTPALQGLYLWSVETDPPALVYPTLTSPPADPASRPNSDQEASLRRAQALLLRDQPEAAWRELSDRKQNLAGALSESRLVSTRLDVLLRRRLLAGAALRKVGDLRRERQLLERTAAEVANLPTALLVDALPWATHPLMDALELVSEPTDLAAMRASLDAARLRLAGAQSVAALLPALTALATEERHLAGLPAASDPDEATITPADLLVEDSASPRQGLVLVYALTPRGDLGVAAQWDENALSQDLLNALPSDGMLGAPVILDDGGEIIAGASRCGDHSAPRVWAQVPLSSLLTNRQLGLCATRERPSPGDDSFAILAAIAPIALSLLLGGAALAGRVSADRRQAELYERQRAFTTRVTHELKTPLAGIRVMAETLEIGAFRDAEQRAQLALRIQDEVDRLSQRVDEVLRVARSDRIDRAEPVDVPALLAELVVLWKPRFEAVQATIETDFVPCPSILADAPLLRDALNNLLDNALKYLREDRRGQVRVSARPDGRWLVVEIADNGLGVPTAQRRAIFQPFVRVEGPDRGKSGGHGLGLSFVAETARAHGGTVECRDGIDGGARFVLRLRRSIWKKDGWRASLSSKTTTPSP